MVAQVLVELSSRNVDKTFDYLVPSKLEEEIQVGIRVLVPFGAQKLEGFVLCIKEMDQDTYDSEKLKEILEVIDQEVILNQELLKLGEEISKTTLSTLISSYQVMLPEALKARKKTQISKKIESYLSLGVEENISSMNESQKKIFELVKKEGRVLKSNLTKISASSVKTLLKKGILIEEKEETYRLKKDFTLKEKYPLTSLQQEIVDEVLKKKEANQTFLLHGVTGSGKTEVYMELIEHVLKEGKSSIVLVPEISLTEQIVSRFKSRFGDDIAILHSRLSSGEKYDEWRKISRHEVKIVIGARSAIFAPLE
ncbi:MAG: DEAD/DEAH box helicase family protein, partial [Bacilli bacterium]|nr:DEAD/DEAH box helicase family protein [Bacilli bacterium]